MHFSTSDFIQLLGTIASIITAVVSCAIAVKSLKFSEKAIKLSERSITEANRPYVVVYRDYIQVLNTVHEYIIVKNFGKTGAVIDSLTFSPELFDSIRNELVFKNLSETNIAPGQSLTTVSKTNAFIHKDKLDIIQATIKYHDNDNSYSEIFLFNENLIEDLLFTKTKPTKSTSTQDVIVKASEEILRRNL